ncbi:MAG TPA: D-alanine--D-alanine ligase, partial [Spirochaetia bacterium]
MKSDTIAIVYGAVDAAAPADERDVLDELVAVREALHGLGYQTVDVPLTLDLADAAAELRAAAPIAAFNLAETIGGKGSLVHIAPSLLDSMGIPFTGASCEATVLTSHKLLAKKTLTAAGIPTPPWVTGAEALRADPPFAPPWIVKSVWEHASIGLEDCSVVDDREDLERELVRRTQRESIEHLFVEGFIEGRELNLALLAGPGAVPEGLPPAEIRFVGYPAGKPRMVGYRAKWADGSFESSNTVRSYDFPPEDAGLLAELGATSVRCWS